MKKPFFTGLCTALVTPFLDRNVNYPMLEQLLRRQLDAGVHTVVVTGTTGEASTMPDEYGNGMYEVLVDELTDTTVKSDWMTKFTPELVQVASA